MKKIIFFRKLLAKKEWKDIEKSLTYSGQFKKGKGCDDMQKSVFQEAENIKKGDIIIKGGKLLIRRSYFEKSFGKKDISKLHLETITDKNGKQRKVWVKNEDLKKPSNTTKVENKLSIGQILDTLKNKFGISKQRIADDYSKNNIEKEFKATKETFTKHIFEFLRHKEKWTSFFSSKKKNTNTINNANGKNSKKITKKDNLIKVGGEKKVASSSWNKELMKKIVSIYGDNTNKESEEEKHNNRSQAMLGNDNAKKIFKDISDVIDSNGETNIKTHKGNVKFAFENENGKTGLKHIILRRYEEKSKNKENPISEEQVKKEISALVYSCVDTLQTSDNWEGQKDGRSYLVKKGGITVIVRDSDGKLVVTGFEDNSKKDEATETIKAVNAEYGNDIGFLELYDRVGAVISSFKNISQLGEKSSPLDDEQTKNAQKNTEIARKKSGLPKPIERVSVTDDTDDSFNPNSENYRYKDTGYIAGSRKEEAQLLLFHAGRNHTRVRPNEIDWDGLEENSRAAEKYITKSNVFGEVDWQTLRENGMTGGAAFLIDRIYASAGTKPDESTPDARKNFVIAINGMRDRFEECKTIDDVIKTLDEIHDERNGIYASAKETPEYKKLKIAYDELDKKSRELQTQRDVAYVEYQNVKNQANNKMRDEIKDLLVQKKAITWNARFHVSIQGNKDGYKTVERAKSFLENQVYAKIKIDKLSNEDLQKIADILDGANDKIKTADKKYSDFIAENNTNYFSGYLDEKGDVVSRDDARNMANTRFVSGYFADKKFLLSLGMKAVMKKEGAKLLMDNPLYKAWSSLGSKCLINGTTRNFVMHRADARRGKYDDWSWAEKDKIKIDNTGKKRKEVFELKVAVNYSRKGGRNVSAKSTLELKEMFNLRDIQSGNWVLKDPESAKWHVDHCCEGFADLCDITGISDSLISLNGRLALAIGARGHGSRTGVAHYEPIERVINITKMKGGGSLAHEWFHSFDNLLSEAISGGDINAWYSNEGNHGSGKASVEIPEVKTAFDNLVKAMTQGDKPILKEVKITATDFRNAQFYFSENKEIGYKPYRDLIKSVKECKNLTEARKLIDNKKDEVFNRMGNKKFVDFQKMTTAYFAMKENPNIDKQITFKDRMDIGIKGSQYLADASNLESGSTDYWSTPHEMAARAFAAYIEDSLDGADRKNEYLSCLSHNSDYVSPLGGPRPYPDGEERKKINEAFKQLFEVVAKNKAIRKSIEWEDIQKLSKSLGKGDTTNVQDVNMETKEIDSRIKKSWCYFDRNGKFWIKKSVVKDFLSK